MYACASPEVGGFQGGQRKVEGEGARGRGGETVRYPSDGARPTRGVEATHDVAETGVKGQGTCVRVPEEGLRRADGEGGRAVGGRARGDAKGHGRRSGDARGQSGHIRRDR